MHKFNKGWYVLHTKPNYEKKIVEKLSEKNVVYFLPTIMKLRKWHDRKKYVEVPVFPSYIFIYLNSIYDYYSGLNAEGVLRYVRFGKEIAKVEVNVIKKLQIAFQCENEIEISDKQFQLGQEVYIDHGALTGLKCEIVEYQNKMKVLIRLSLLNRNILLSLPESSLLKSSNLYHI